MALKQASARFERTKAVGRAFHRIVLRALGEHRELEKLLFVEAEERNAEKAVNFKLAAVKVHAGLAGKMERKGKHGNAVFAYLNAANAAEKAGFEGLQYDYSVAAAKNSVNRGDTDFAFKIIFGIAFTLINKNRDYMASQALELLLDCHRSSLERHTYEAKNRDGTTRKISGVEMACQHLMNRTMNMAVEALKNARKCEEEKDETGLTRERRFAKQYLEKAKGILQALKINGAEMSEYAECIVAIAQAEKEAGNALEEEDFE